MNKRVAVITGFYKSPYFLIKLFEYLDKQTHKMFDVFVYNYSCKEVEELKNKTYSFKYVILKLNENVGFAGGNNHAIQEAKNQFDYQYYALINDDTKPDKDWLTNLVQPVENDPTTGAVTSKMIYYEPYILIDGLTQVIAKRDARELGLRFYTNTHCDNTFYHKKFYNEGFFSQEEDEIYHFRWTGSKFSVAVPISMDNGGSRTLNLFLRKNRSIKEQKVSFYAGEDKIGDILLQEDKIHYQLKIPENLVAKHRCNIIQNAGSNFDDNYNGFDVGSGEFDKGQYDELREVNLFCGGACLLTKDALVKTGLFNGHYFSYYEDSDLSLRLRRKGFKIIYNPAAIVQHFHSGTSQEWSPFFTYYVFRNKIIFSAKNFGLVAFVKAIKERGKETWLFFKWASKSRFKDPKIKARLKLNMRILIDSLIGVIKYKPAKF